jgi:signal transduction histidine kinase
VRGERLENEVSVFGKVLSVTVEPLIDERNQTRGFIRVMRDVTMERRAQEQLLKAERFATLGQVLSGIAHDVGTPLNIISGYSEFLLMRTKPDTQGHKELSAILHQTRRIATLLGEAVDLARTPQGRTDAIDIKVFLAEALDLAGHYLRRAEVKADLTCRMSAPLVYGEATRLRQAFFNILLNASQRVGPGGKLDVVIDEAPDRPEFLKLAFWGNDANGLGHDFSESLVCFLRAQSESGTGGLGLSLAKEILAEAGAEVNAGAVGERGVPLIILLPLNAGARA